MIAHQLLLGLIIAALSYISRSEEIKPEFVTDDDFYYGDYYYYNPAVGEVPVSQMPQIWSILMEPSLHSKHFYSVLIMFQMPP